MPYIYHSKNLNHQIHDEKGKAIAQFEPTPKAEPKKGVFPTHGVLVTEDKKLAQLLEGLKDHGIERAAGSDDPGAAKPDAK